MRPDSARPRPSPQETEILLDRWCAGDRSAAGDLLELCYSELRRLAGAYFLRERADHTLQATALVHEAFLSIAGQHGMQWKNRAHFIGFMARVMRRVLVDHARERRSQRRGGGWRKLALSETSLLATSTLPDIEALEDALRDLASWDARKAALVELRFYGGLPLEEAAEVLEISRATAVREWGRARAWLYRALSQDAVTDPSAKAGEEVNDGS